MDQRVKKLWVDGLRSGKYQQRQGNLHSRDKFCALGVLCDIYSKETETPWKKSRTGIQFMHDEFDVLPNEVVAWAGLDGKSPVVEVEFRDKQGRLQREHQNIGHVNDCHIKFPVIAKYIEEQL